MLAKVSYQEILALTMIGNNFLIYGQNRADENKYNYNEFDGDCSSSSEFDL